MADTEHLDVQCAECQCWSWLEGSDPIKWGWVWNTGQWICRRCADALGSHTGMGARESTRYEGDIMNQKAVEEKARQLAAATFSDGTMRTMLYERIVDAFGAPILMTGATENQ